LALGGINLSDLTASQRPLAIFQLPSIRGQWLVVGLFSWFILNQFLLLLFLGIGNISLWGAGGLLACGLLFLVHRAKMDLGAIPLSRLLLLFAFALSLYMLGGEGRFFYANIDWQVRDAVLRDMTINAWPFVYLADGRPPELLRAAIGFFLVPSLAAKAYGERAGEIALLLQNALLLTALLGLGSTLFGDFRQRAIALFVVTLFSGADFVMELIVSGRLDNHLEFGVPILQYSSHITQAFWVPQHAFAGWVGALMVLLSHRKMIPLWILLAMVPLTALWSPLPLIGIMPFIAYLAIDFLRNRQLTISDFTLPVLSVLLVLPAFIYLSAAPDVVGFNLAAVPAAVWFLFILVECTLWLFPLLAWRRGPYFGLLVVATVVLLALPFMRVGWSIDLMMRGSIPALAILSVAAADAIANRELLLERRLWLIGALALGSVTGSHEISRALTEPTSPRGSCSFYGAWDVSFKNYPKGSHLAPLDRVPASIRPNNPQRVRVNDPAPCWKGEWRRPSGV
jgi:hypothetical protein